MRYTYILYLTTEEIEDALNVLYFPTEEIAGAGERAQRARLLSGSLPIKFNGHENSNPLDLRVCLSQTLRNPNS